MGEPDMYSKYIDHDLSNHVGFDRRFKYYQPVKPTWKTMKMNLNHLYQSDMGGFGMIYH